MDFKQKYNEAFERAKKLKETCDSTAVIGWCEYIFPELKESEDEKIRKEIIKLVKFFYGSSLAYKHTISRDKMLAWLEKQGEMNIQNNNPLKIEPDKFYFCIKDYFAGGCCRSKKGDVVLAKNGMNMMGLSPEQASEYFIPINPFKEKAVAWFEKQSDKLQGLSALEALQEEMLDNANKIESKFMVGDWVIQENIGVYKVIEICKSWYEVIDSEDNHYSISFDKECMCHLWTIEDAKEGDVLSYVTDEEDLWIMIYWSLYKPYKGHVHYHALLVNNDFSDKGTCCIDIDYLKPATKEQQDFLFQKMKEAGYEWNAEKKVLKKIKLKFNIGDWIVTADGKVNQVISVDEDGDGYTLDDDTYFSGSWCDKYHLWTIDDAREGDVLKEDSCIFIIEKMNPNGTAIVHCCLFDDGEFDLTGSTLGFDVDSTCPATKEQRDFLFQKMKEAGYEWDVKKKELKKIEDVPENYKRQVMSEMTNLVKDYIQQKPTWSEDDEKMFQTIIADLKGFKHDNTSCLAPHFDNCIAWLNSLKDRYTWKPSDEQMDALNLAIGEANAVDTAAGDEAAEILTSLYEQLKKIMEK